MIDYQDVTLAPSGEFSYEENSDEEDEGIFFWSYVGIFFAFIISAVLLIVALVTIIVSVSTPPTYKIVYIPLPLTELYTYPSHLQNCIHTPPTYRVVYIPLPPTELCTCTCSSLLWLLRCGWVGQLL